MTGANRRGCHRHLERWAKHSSPWNDSGQIDAAAEAFATWGRRSDVAQPFNCGADQLRRGHGIGSLRRQWCGLRRGCQLGRGTGSDGGRQRMTRGPRGARTLRAQDRRRGTGSNTCGLEGGGRSSSVGLGLGIATCKSSTAIGSGPERPIGESTIAHYGTSGLMEGRPTQRTSSVRTSQRPTRGHQQARARASRAGGSRRTARAGQRHRSPPRTSSHTRPLGPRAVTQEWPCRIRAYRDPAAWGRGRRAPATRKRNALRISVIGGDRPARPGIAHQVRQAKAAHPRPQHRADPDGVAVAVPRLLRPEAAHLSQHRSSSCQQQSNCRSFPPLLHSDPQSGTRLNTIRLDTYGYVRDTVRGIREDTYVRDPY